VTQARSNAQTANAAAYPLQCQWLNCQREAAYFGLSSSNVMLCAVHLPEHLRLLQQELNAVVGHIHKALSAVISKPFFDEL